MIAFRSVIVRRPGVCHFRFLVRSGRRSRATLRTPRRTRPHRGTPLSCASATSRRPPPSPPTSTAPGRRLPPPRERRPSCRPGSATTRPTPRRPRGAVPCVRRPRNASPPAPARRAANPLPFRQPRATRKRSASRCANYRSHTTSRDCVLCRRGPRVRDDLDLTVLARCVRSVPKAVAGPAAPLDPRLLASPPRGRSAAVALVGAGVRACVRGPAQALRACFAELKVGLVK